MKLEPERFFSWITRLEFQRGIIRLHLSDVESVGFAGAQRHDVARFSILPLGWDEDVQTDDLNLGDAFVEPD